ncbi:hypothetical protein VNO77_19426 [Canavalia gladiata]|uniref:Uncharacterized protein n=1 Tax=Canavalia gladiata TaxID=3824 RepID=A0AAN9QKG4_CANGL
MLGCIYVIPISSSHILISFAYHFHIPRHYGCIPCSTPIISHHASMHSAPHHGGCTLSHTISYFNASQGIRFSMASKRGEMGINAGLELRKKRKIGAKMTDLSSLEPWTRKLQTIQKLAFERKYGNILNLLKRMGRALVQLNRGQD